MAIVNMKYTSAIEKAINESQFSFFITGSHFFGGATEKSDLDFFVQDSAEVRSFLEGQGFSEDFDHSYVDRGCCLVYKVVITHPFTTIHVQVVKDAAIKNKAQALIVQSGIHLSWIPKEGRKYVWELAMCLAHKTITREEKRLFSMVTGTPV